ncbi:MAG: response regulator transcription factor [Chloroflexota bacterium]|nr:response regulator transcription factor [Chloroflexota bacterium]
MKAFIVEDDLETTEAISLIFKLRWPEVEFFSTTKGSEVALMVEKETPDVIILDLGLPDIDGIEVLKEIREFSNVPIIIVTARGDSTSQVKGLELGADDYVAKPFDPAVLLARIKNVITHGRITLDQATAPFTTGSLVIDFSNHQVSLQGKPFNLTPTEYKLLCHMARNPGRVLRHENILRTVWGEGYEKDITVLKSCIHQLRRKLVEAGADPEIIGTERGIGYRLITPN